MPAVEARTGAAKGGAAVAQGTGNGARSRGGGATGGRLCVQWLTQGSALGKQGSGGCWIIMLGWGGGGGGGGNEVNLKSQPPLLFIKVLGSRLVTRVDFVIIAKFSPKTWFTRNSKFQLKIKIILQIKMIILKYT